MDCFVEGRRLTFCCTCAMRSRSRARIFSRSTATAFMRLPSESASSMGIVKVKTVAIAAMAALTIVSVLTLIESIRKSSIGILHPYEAHGFFRKPVSTFQDHALEIEIYHILHHHHAHRHPQDGSGEHHAAERLGPQERDVDQK